MNKKTNDTHPPVFDTKNKPRPTTRGRPAFKLKKANELFKNKSIFHFQKGVWKNEKKRKPQMNVINT